MAFLVILSTLLMAVGLAKMPYGFYMVLRVIVCLTAAVGFSWAWEHQRQKWLWAYGFLAVLYNPLLPVYLRQKELWIIVNALALGCFWVGTVVAYIESRRTRQEQPTRN